MKNIILYSLITALSTFSFGIANACDPIANDDEIILQLTSDVIVVDVLQNDVLDNMDSISVRILRQPTFGTAEVDEETNQIIFTSDGDNGGVLDFEYEVCNYSVECGESCSSAAINLDIVEVPVVPEGLTLNGDGFNEGLRLTNIKDFDRLEITIANRWGHIVYENKNYDNQNPWRGNYGGTDKLVTPGVYYYYLVPYRNGMRIGDVKTTALYIFN